MTAFPVKLATLKLPTSLLKEPMPKITSRLSGSENQVDSATFEDTRLTSALRRRSQLARSRSSIMACLRRKLKAHGQNCIKLQRTLRSTGRPTTSEFTLSSVTRLLCSWKPHYLVISISTV